MAGLDRVGNLVRKVDELRDVGVTSFLKLPRICVVGAQSAGKSSVIESIAGFDFLPRGHGCVTRRPLELRLHHDVHANPMYAKFNPADPLDAPITDFQEVKRLIETKTNAEAKEGQIIEKPLPLHFYGANLPNLTLIDLPGITRVAIKNQDANIEQLTKDLATKYIKDDATIILAVSPANADPSTSDALSMAQQHDPQLLRTVGVLTKVDIMGPGTDAVKTLNGCYLKLKLGYVAVKCRSTQDINTQSIADAKIEEMNFFSNPPYDQVEQKMLGVQSLTNLLTDVLYDHILKALPEIRGEVAKKKKELLEIRDQLGEAVPIDETQLGGLYAQLASIFATALDSWVRGKYDQATRQSGLKHYGCEIREIFNKFLSDMKPTELEDKDIREAIQRHEGDKLYGFTSVDTFESLIKPPLMALKQDVLKCLEDIVALIGIVSNQLILHIYSKYDQCAKSVQKDFANLIELHRNKTQTLLSDMFEAQTQYLFTNDSEYVRDHRDFIGTSFSSSEVQAAAPGPPQSPGPLTSPKPTSRSFAPNNGHDSSRSFTQNNGHDSQSSTLVRQIRERYQAYFMIVLNNLRDSVPRIIGQFFVRKASDPFLVGKEIKMDSSVSVQELLTESSEVVHRRKENAKMLLTVEEAERILETPESLLVAPPEQQQHRQQQHQHQHQQQHQQHQQQHRQQQHQHQHQQQHQQHQQHQQQHQHQHKQELHSPMGTTYQAPAESSWAQPWNQAQQAQHERY